MLSHCAPTTAAPASVTAAATTTAASAASTTAREGYLDLQRQVAADGVEQRLGRSLPAHQHQLQVHVPFDQQAFGQQADTRDAAQRRLAVRPEGGEVRVGEGGGGCQSGSKAQTQIQVQGFYFSSHNRPFH